MNLEKSISKVLEATGPLEPLPTTRELGEQFSVSHVTVSRSLRRMLEGGILWQAHSGRFYRAKDEASLARPRPVGCLVRSLSGWGAWYEGIMAGVGRACEVESRGILVQPAADLVRQRGPGEKTRFLPQNQQQQLLTRYLDRNPKETVRLLLDDAWSDKVIRMEAGRLGLARMLMRPGPIEGMQSCYPNFEQGALLGLFHLLEEGYEDIYFVQPYLSYPTTSHLEKSFVQAFKRLGGNSARFKLWRSDGASEFPSLIAELKRKRKRRSALVCPEDNFSVLLLRYLREAGLQVPKQVGLLGAMGTRILQAEKVSCLKIDFIELGERAVTGPFGEDGHALVDFTFERGGTT